MKRISILGLPVDTLSMEEALSEFDKLVSGEELSVIITANSIMLEDATRQEELAGIINRAALVIPDGIGLVYASKIKKEALSERVTGIDFCYNALKHCAEQKKKVFFLGAKPGIAQEAANRLMNDIPGLEITGTRDGYFKAEDEADVVEQINASDADFICVAMGSPKQELFLERHRNELKAKVGVGVGGSFDVWSGNTRRAPEFYCKHGLEWFYRLINEPYRFWRMLKIPVFLIRVLFDK